MIGTAVRKGDKLFLLYAASTAPSTLTAFVDVLEKNGSLHRYTITLASFTADRTLQTNEAASREINVDGTVAGGGLIGNASALKRGQCYALLILDRPGLGATVLAKNYVYASNPVAIGELVEAGPGGGHGFIRYIATADPAANAEVLATACPTDALWRPLGFNVTMVQGITDTPRPAILIRELGGLGGGRYLVPLSADVAVSTTVECTWARGAQTILNNVTGGSMVAPMPDVLLNEGDDIGTSTQGLGANSNYGAATVIVEEWIDL